MHAWLFSILLGTNTIFFLTGTILSTRAMVCLRTLSSTASKMPPAHLDNVVEAGMFPPSGDPVQSDRATPPAPPQSSSHWIHCNKAAVCLITTQHTGHLLTTSFAVVGEVAALP